MARPAPADLDYAPTQAKTFVNPVAVDLTTQFAIPANASPSPPAALAAATSGEYFYAATLLRVSTVTGGALVVRMQADPTTNVSILIGANANCIEFRGAFVQLVSAVTDMSVTAFWQGGPC